jgi:CHAT domain-containing protein
MQSHRALILSAGAGSHEPLPYAERESRMVSERFPGSASKVLAQASLRTVVSELGNASIVHVCCHGVFEWNEPGLSGLELSDGRLTINNLTSAPAGWPQMCVVFLSSCESGIAGASAVPDEFLGIHTAFLQGGARAAIGTLWAVYDDTAMVFADRFYRYYLDGHSREAMPPSAALSKAQHWLRTVTVRQLLDEGLFEPNEVPVLLHRGNRQSAKLRWPRRSDQTAPVKGTERAPRAVRTSRRILASTPYASPMEWAAFVIMGV